MGINASVLIRGILDGWSGGALVDETYSEWKKVRGQRMQQDRQRSINEQLLSFGAKHYRSGLVLPNEKCLLVTCRGTKTTGSDSPDPPTTYSARSGSMIVNMDQLWRASMPIQASLPTMSRELWVLLVTYDRAHLYAEVSRPRIANDTLRLVGWDARLKLPPLPLPGQPISVTEATGGGSPGSSGAAGGEGSLAIEVPVTPKKS